MARGLHEFLLGSRFERNLDLLAAVVIFLGTFVAYATNLFTVGGGVVLLPADATHVGLLVAASIGYRRGGLLLAWVTLFAAHLGFYAEWAFLGLSSHSPAGKLAFLFDPTGLAVVAVAAVVLGTSGFLVGSLVRRGIELVGGGDSSADSGK